MLLAAAGLYAVMATGVAQRTRELGVRMALGANSNDVLGMVLKQGAILAGSGIAIGLLGAFGLTRLMEAMLFGVSATDPMTFVLVAAVLGGVAMLASYLPARRAARTDPVEALRAE